MSLTENSISLLDAPPTYPELRDLLIEAIQAYSRELWTDYNTHDPGLTIGEHLCFGLTEALHVARLPIADLLAENPEEPDEFLTSHYPAHEILVCRPVTRLDFRKVIIDQPGVKNAWLSETQDLLARLWVDRKRMRLSQSKPADQPEEKLILRGFHRVRVEFEPHVPQTEHSARLAEIRRVLEASRNLCEVFLEIEAVKREEIGLCVDLEIADDADVNDVMAEAYYALERFIAPPVVFHSLQQRLAQGLSTEDIFNGPLLAHGFIDDEELAATEPKPDLRASDLIQALMDVPGVVAVKRLIMTRYQDGVAIESGARWLLPLDTERSTQLSMTKSRFRFYKGKLPFNADPALYQRHLEDLRGQDRFMRHAKGKNVLEAPQGKHRRISSFETIQNAFPLNYGIGRVGLGPSEPPLRKAQALQLKAYLLALESYISGYVSQVANARSLFSLDDGAPALFAKAPARVHQFAELTGKDETAFQDDLQQATETEAERLIRRNRMLDHLLGRFAETFEAYALIAGRLYGADAAKQLMRDKIEWLKNYPELSGHRFAAFDIQGPARDFWNVSGLEKRGRTLLGLTRRLGDCVEFYEEEDDDDILEFRFRIRGDDGAILMSSTVNYPSLAAADNELLSIAANAADPTRYEIRQAVSGEYYIVLLDETGEVIAMRKDFYNTQVEAELAVARLVKFFEGKIGAEPVHVLEHILLRPGLDPAELLPICDPLTPDAAPYSVDPYSFRITVLLPAWPERFRNVFFRQYMERFVREQTPAHIYPKICWVSAEQMQDFENAYYPWREALGAGAPDLNVKRNRLVLVWSVLRSQFPQATLHGCVSATEDNPVVLDNTTLGTLVREDGPGENA